MNNLLIFGYLCLLGEEIRDAHEREEYLGEIDLSHHSRDVSKNADVINHLG